MAHDVFVSHSVKDKGVAEAVVTRLEADAVTCWIAPRDVVPGADWGESIIDAIESSRIMVLLFSQSANASPQIKREVERAVNKGVYIIPFRVEDIRPARALEYFISTSQWIDAFSPPLERHLDTLARTVKAVLKSPPSVEATVSPQFEKKSPTTIAPISRPPARKSTLIAGSIALAMIVGGAGWYLGHKNHAPSAESSKSAQPERQVAMISTGDEVASKEPEAIAAQPYGKDVKNSAVLPAKDVANAAQPNEAYAAPNSETADLTSKLATGEPWPQPVPNIAGNWRDSDYRAVSQITQNGNSFRFTRWAPSQMELNSAPPAPVRFLGNTLRAAITQDIKPARPRGERARVPYRGMKCRFNWTAAILSLARSPVLRITSKARHESVASTLT